MSLPSIWSIYVKYHGLVMKFRWFAQVFGQTCFFDATAAFVVGSKKISDEAPGMSHNFR